MCDTQSDPKTAFEKQTVPIIFRELADSSQFDVFVSRLTLVLFRGDFRTKPISTFRQGWGSNCQTLKIG
jgi:hypothetical protein